MRELDLQIPETSWTAVTRGAAIFGIEKSASKVTMSACTEAMDYVYMCPFQILPTMSGIVSRIR